MFTLSAKTGGWHQGKAGQNFHTYTILLYKTPFLKLKTSLIPILKR